MHTHTRHETTINQQRASQKKRNGHIIERNIYTNLLDKTKVYLFIGCIMMGTHWSKYVAGSLVAFVGIGYIALEFVPSIEPPANMR